MQEQIILDAFCKKLAAYGFDIFSTKKPAQDASPSEKQPWITMNGTHIPIGEGESHESAAKKFIAKKQDALEQAKHLEWKATGSLYKDRTQIIEGLKKSGFSVIQVTRDYARVTDKEGNEIRLQLSTTGDTTKVTGYTQKKQQSTTQAETKASSNSQHSGSQQKQLSVSETLSAAKPPVRLSQAQKDAITDYTGDPYINNSLRKKESLEQSPVSKQQLEQLDSIFKNASTKEPITVYRGIGDTMGEASWVKDLKAGKLKEGSTIHDNGFMSTSADMTTPKEAISESRTPVMIKIDVPKGSKAVSISEYSSFPEQNEVLLNRGGNLKINKISPMRNDAGNTGYLIHASYF